MNCNITFGMCSTTPLLSNAVENGKFISNSRNMERLAMWKDVSWKSVRIIVFDAGEAANLDTKKLFSKNIVEILPIFIPISSTNSIGKLTPIVAEQKIVMVSFASEVKENSTDIVNLFNWDLAIYGGIIVMTALLFHRLWVSYSSIGEALKAFKSTTWTMVQLISSQNFSFTTCNTSRILITSLILLIFFLMAFLNSLISTDLVVGEKPFMLDKLEDVLDPRASRFTPVWRKFGGEYETFRQSHSSIKQKIWQKAQKIGLDKCLIDNDVIFMVNMAINYSSNPIVGFVYEVVSNFVKIQSCSELSPLVKKKAHVGIEMAGKELLSFPYHFRNDTCKKKKQLAIETWARTVFEANTFNNDIMKSIIFDTFKLHDSVSKEWKCLFNSDPFEQKIWLKIGISNIGQLLVLLCGGIIISTLTLLSEIIWFKKKPIIQLRQ
ncbi:uncharacterized protein LOC141857238 [Brevipalpus obovatus]|uniref:uncharacterized protein LOC141857238 n=1 Tax=Brevipalpus obovatus TaxID=246614 RepID=UPI003D9F8FF9